MTEIFWIYQVDLFMVNMRENTFRKHNLPTKAHKLLPVLFFHLENESLERNLKMSNYETKSFMITAKVIRVRFMKFSAKAPIANWFYFYDKGIYRLLRHFICVSFVK